MGMPTCTWWYGVERSLAEFITPDAHVIRRTAEDMPPEPRDFYYAVSHWVRDSFRYPLNQRGEPAAEHTLAFYEYGSNCPYRRLANRLLYKLGYVWKDFEKNYLFYRRWEYVWQTPLETILTGYAICIDSSLLCTSLHQVRLEEVYVEVGYVTFRGDPNRYGHAWSIGLIDGEWLLTETTIHDQNVENVIPREEALNGEDVRYHPIERWNKTKYEQLGSWIEVGGFLLAPEKPGGEPYKKWLRLETLKQRKLWEAWPLG